MIRLHFLIQTIDIPASLQRTGGFACKAASCMLICMRLAAKRQVDVACIAASRLQNSHALAAITLQSRQFFAMTLGDQLFE